MFFLLQFIKDSCPFRRTFSHQNVASKVLAASNPKFKTYFKSNIYNKLKKYLILCLKYYVLEKLLYKKNSKIILSSKLKKINFLIANVINFPHMGSSLFFYIIWSVILTYHQFYHLASQN